MKYATWNLVFDGENKYATGPEETALSSDVILEGILPLSNLSSGGSILGHVSGSGTLAPGDLSAWNYSEISESAAITVACSIMPDAYVDEFGRIILPFSEEVID